MAKLWPEKVAEALKATPPTGVTGVLVDGRMRRLVGYDGDGSQRMFEFEGLEPMAYRQVARMARSVVLVGEAPPLTHLTIQFGRSKVRCPACRREVSVGSPFWGHYNGNHARRPFWLNSEDWPKMLKGPYVPPPEQA